MRRGRRWVPGGGGAELRDGWGRPCYALPLLRLSPLTRLGLRRAG